MTQGTGAVNSPDKQSAWTTLSRKLVPVVFLTGTALVAYHNSFNGPFIFDDTKSIPENPHIRQLWPLWRAMSWPNPSTVAGRPITALSLAVNYALGGLNVWGYHVFNLTVHFLASLVLFGLVRRTLLTNRLRDRYGSEAPWLAMTVALIWLVHPLQTESVTYVIQRTESLMGLFFLLTLYLIVVGFTSRHRHGWYAAAVVACAFGMGCKESMVVAPLLVLIYDRVFLANSFETALRERRVLYAGLFSTWLVLAGLLMRSPHAESAGFGFAHLTPWDYAKTQAGVILHYLRLSVWPHPLVVDYYDWPVARTLGAAVPSGVAVLLLLGATLWAARHQPPLAFLGGAFFMLLGPTSSFLPLVGEVAAERRMYLPLAAVVVFAVMGAHTALRRLLPDTAFRRRLIRVIGVPLLVAVVTTLGYLTVRRNDNYRSEESVWRDVVAKRPNNVRGRNNLGQVLESQGRIQEAMAQFSEAVRIRPHFAAAQNNLGTLLARQGQVQEAIIHFSAAVRSAPDYGKARKNLGDALLRQGNVSEAIDHLSEAVRIRPNDPGPHYSLATALRRAGRLDEAIVQFAEVLRLLPDHAPTHYQLGVAYLQKGEIEDASQHLQAAVRIDPNHRNARRALENIRLGITAQQ